MCGLAGILSYSHQDGSAARTLVSQMIVPLHHRGPNAHGVWMDDGFAIGHRRLAIQDLSEAGAQPMHSSCGRFVIAFNGEIYNHADLRVQLEQEGAAPEWRGHSDTETLLAAIVCWGLDRALRRVAGMFAIALWDRQKKLLSLARDRIGEKPLYWGWAGSSLVFGSELKALRVHPGFPGEVCRKALALYVQFAYVPAPRSIHPGVYKLEAGCVLEVGDKLPESPPQEPMRSGDQYGGVSIRRYWSLNDEIETGRQHVFADEGDALSALDAVLQCAVSRQMLADVPLGAFLSGGVDSSLIAALMQAQSTSRVRTFTIGFESRQFNEAPFAKAVAQHLGTDHAEMFVTQAEARSVIPDLPDLYDEPFADSSQIPTHLVCRAARQHVTVALSGDGGDELFGGYTRYVWGPKIGHRFGGMPLRLRRALSALLTAVPGSMWDRVGALLGGVVSHPGDKLQKLAFSLPEAHSVDGLYRRLVSQWPEGALVHGVAGGDAGTAIDDPMPLGLNGDASAAARMMVQDMRSYLPDDILCKVDRAAMGISLETRVPFLDPDVIALSARLPASMKIREGQGKWALRQLLYRYVPRELIDRPKTGFGVPIGDWLRGPLKEWAEDLLSMESLARDGLLEPALIRAAWVEHLSGRRDWTHRLWVILMFMAWRRRWS